MTAVARAAVKAAQAAATPRSTIAADCSAIEDLIALIEMNIALARAVEVEPDEPEEECKEIQHVWAM